MKLLFLVLMVLFVGCSNDAVSSHDVIPIASDISSSAVAPASSSEKIVEQNSSSSIETLSSAEESSSSSESLSSSSESAESSSSSEQESSSSSVLEVKSSSSSSLVLIYGEMTDERDGQKYRTVYIEKIGRTWMIQNLNYAYLQPTAELDSSSWCQNDDPENCEKDGRLYIWSAAMDSAALFSEDGKGCGNGVTCTFVERVQGVCPKGWHLPNEEEWNDFVWVALGGYRSVILAKQSNEVELYEDELTDLSSLFFGSNGETVDYWTSEESIHNYATDAETITFMISVGDVDRGVRYKFAKNRVRCLQDYEIEE